MDRRILRFATYLAPNMFPVYQFIADHVGEQLGYATSLTVGSSFDGFEQGQVDVGFVCGLPYVRLARKQPAPVELLVAPVLQDERCAGQPLYYGDVIVRSESPFRTFADLRGSSWSYNEVGSHSGYNITRHHMIQLRETSGYFGRLVASGSHQKSIDMVLRGEVDASAIDSQVLEIELRNRPELRQRLRVIDALGPSPSPPIVAATTLPAELREEMRALLTGLDSDPRARPYLDMGLIERFLPVTDATYDPIREMLAAVERTGFFEL